MEGNWISCADRVPDKPGHYLVYYWYVDAILVYYWDGQKWGLGNNITHWMELPNKPDDAVSVAVDLGAAKVVPRGVEPKGV